MAANHKGSQGPVATKCDHLRDAKATPEVSIIVVNFNKSDLTRDCLRHIWTHTRDRQYEILVVDNGSSAAEFQKLADFAGEFHLVRLPVNRFFGEGNNIGVEASRGRFVVFLNNDAFVTDNWLGPLINVLENQPDAGGVGAKFLYPDGRLQEAGAVLDERGMTIQRGKLYDLEPASRDSIGIVDYCSAACFATTRAIFDRISGFDPTYEPGYYEDTDLCLRITSLGLSIYYCPHSVVHHIENATASAFQDALDNIKETNRQKFLFRWGNYLSARAVTEAPLPPLVPLPPYPPVRPRARHDPQSKEPIAVFHTPYDLMPCDRERYLLTAACALSNSHRVYVATDARYSSYRLDHLARELSLDLSRILLVTRAELHRLRAIDVFCHIGQHLYPVVPAMGQRSFYMCRFPFLMNSENSTESWDNLRGYDRVLVDSPFVCDVLRGKINAFQFDAELEVLAPPLPSNPPTTKHAAVSVGRTVIVTLGDFFAEGQNQRHDVLIEGISRLAAAEVDAELHIVGALYPHPKNMLHPAPEDMRHYDALRRQAKGLPVIFHPNATTDGVRHLLSRATIYWHATGFEIDPQLNPEKCEPFGIRILEAMAMGCIPFVVSNGGPIEFVHEGNTGFQFATLEELTMKTRSILRDPARAAEVSARAIQEAHKFAAPMFANQWSKIVGGPLARAQDENKPLCQGS